MAKHRTVLSIFQRDPSLTPTIAAVYDELFGYAKKQLGERGKELGDDFLSQLIREHEAGELWLDELEDFAVMLLEASTDNTSPNCDYNRSSNRYAYYMAGDCKRTTACT